MIKLKRARSLLYRGRFLQPNTHSLAFFKIYKIHTPSHRSQFKIFAKSRQTFFEFLFEILKKSRFFDNFHRILIRFWWIFLGISPNILENVEKSWNSQNFWWILRIFSEFWKNCNGILMFKSSICSIGRRSNLSTLVETSALDAAMRALTSDGALKGSKVLGALTEMLKVANKVWLASAQS